MPQKTFRYKNTDITVIWQPGLCQHSTLCWKDLSQVFNPQQKPWINMDGASSERIIDQVKKCPSGALSYIQNEEKDKVAETG